MHNIFFHSAQNLTVIYVRYVESIALHVSMTTAYVYGMTSSPIVHEIY